MDELKACIGNIIEESTDSNRLMGVLAIERHNRYRAKLYKAKSILVGIPELIREAEMAGIKEATLMTFDSCDINLPEGSPKNVCQPEWLRGVVKIVFRRCQKLGLAPTIKYAGSSKPRYIFELVLHW